MKLFLTSLVSIMTCATSFAADTFPVWGWELLSYTTPFRSSPISFGSGSAATVSPAIITETGAESSADALPTRGLFGKGWPSEAQLSPSCYVEFTMNHVGAEPLYIGYVQVPLFREAPNTSNQGEHGPRRWALRWSRDNYQSDLGPEFNMSANNNRSESVYRVELWQQPPVSEAVTFRLYGYDAPSSQGSGGVVVVNSKLYIGAGTRPPHVGIPPRDSSIRRLTPPYFSVRFEGSYGGTFGLEKSGDMLTWVPAGVADVRMDAIDNQGSFLVSAPGNTANLFYRVVER